MPMKSCLICTSSSDDAAATCPRCGEASWSSSNAMPKADEVVITDDVTAEMPKGKRTKKQ